MKLNRLQAKNLRNLEDVSLQLDPSLNLFAGNNGSGKTSLLESVYFLGSGRSFRGTQIDPIIRHGESTCLVSGEVSSDLHGTINLGFQREATGARVMRVNGESQSQASELARFLPTLLLGPDTVELLRGPPPGRRSFINWGVFHVEQSFTGLWRQGIRALKQRNVLLRDGGSDKELEPWTHQLAEVGEQIDCLRDSYLQRFLPVFTETYRFLLDLEGVKCSYRRGWDSAKKLREVFDDQLLSDRKRGFTQSGFQRADLRMTVDGTLASNVCSRGELKLLSWSMVLAQGFVLNRETSSRPVFLVDDLIAELDGQRQRLIAELLLQQGGQVLVTGTDSDLLKALWGGTIGKMFHVEHGSINEREQAE